jgi:DNA invertase Pin-like site-specific DNA recombinase
VALVGLVRVSTDKQNVDRQHDALDPICIKVFEEKLSGKLEAEERPALMDAIEYVRDGDMLCVQEVDRLGRNLLEGLIVLNDLFERGIAVKVLEGIAAGEHTERSLILDLALALAEDRRRDIVKKTKDGLAAARKRGRVGGRRPVMTEPLVIQAVALRAQGFTLKQIQPHLRITDGANKGKNPSVGAISQALRAYDASLEVAQ